MKATKDGSKVESSVVGDDDNRQNGFLPPKYMGTIADKEDMSVMGKSQVLRRNFRLLTSGLTDGGTAGLIWGFLIVTAGVSLVFSSLAEMSSMAPTSGGQYHWVSEFAPPSCQRFLSWLCATGWQCAIVTIAFLAGTIIQGLVVLNYENYVFEAWHGTMITIAITAFSVLFNTFLAKRLPLVEALILVIHITGLFIIIIPLWVLGPRNNAEAVFTEFNNSGGWMSSGTATMVGLSTTITAMIGYDCPVHMSEEVNDASETVPKAMMTALGINALLGFVMLITICFTLGDVNDVLASPTGYPFIQVFYNTTQSLPGTNAMTSVIIILLVSCTITEVATASRQLWSFARDKGLPFSSFFSHVTPGWNIPLNAVIVSLIITVLLSLINIGSDVALFAIVSLTITSLMTSYIITISCLVIKRLRGQPLPPHRWSLGKYGLAINIGALAFLIPLFVFAMFPLTAEVEPATMNWSVVMYGGMLIFSTAYYWLGGRHTYIPPVALVKRDL
ncbi:hypothetical protein FQN54_009228 [Arachnomyces sp. PD_36]|nr:hypothetical protein FQN54_009228 [Arachnomyces sp. PD_36]